MYNNAPTGYGSVSNNATRTYMPAPAPGYTAPAMQHFSRPGYAGREIAHSDIACAPAASYVHEDSLRQNYLLSPQVRHQDVHTSLLAADRPKTQFIGSAALVQQHIEETFEKLVGEPFPKNLCITIGSEDEIRQHHKGAWSRGILGFSLNRQGFGTSEVYVKENDLDILMLTIGHEIGHVMSPTLPNAHDEEAKAFAFELAWVQTLITHNIAGLHECFHPEPAHNGLHDTAFRYIRHLLEQGHEAITIFSDLVWGRRSLLQTLEWRVK